MCGCVYISSAGSLLVVMALRLIASNCQDRLPVCVLSKKEQIRKCCAAAHVMGGESVAKVQQRKNVPP